MEKRFFYAFIGLITIISFLVLSNYTGFFLRSGNFVCQDCNVILITVDTLRADHLSSYGYFQETTPAIDSLADEGVVFSNAFCQIPFTPPSHWSIMTSIYPNNHQKFYPKDDGSDLITISEIMKNNGYKTSGFISSQMLMNFGQGFNHFESASKPKTADEITPNIIEWIEDNSGDKFFLWAHYFDPHSPYDPPEEFKIFDYSNEEEYSDKKYDQLDSDGEHTFRQNIENYDGEIRFVDDQIGKIIYKLEELNISDNTVIVITSDHGECFGEHNFSDFGYEKNYPCIFHGKTLYDVEIKVPLIIKNPQFQGSKKIINIVESVDIIPTILDIVDINDEFEFDGKSLIPLINGKQHKTYTISQTKPLESSISARAIRKDKWKFVLMVPSEFDLEKEMEQQQHGGEIPQEKFTETWKKLLFRVDTGENENLITEQSQLSTTLEKELTSLFTYEVKSSDGIDKETEEILRSLGYLE